MMDPPGEQEPEAALKHLVLCLDGTGTPVLGGGQRGSHRCPFRRGRCCIAVRIASLSLGGLRGEREHTSTVVTACSPARVAERN